MPKSRIAIFIDAENIGARHWPEIAAHAARTGTINSCQIFGDFSEERLGRWLELARVEGLQVAMQLSLGKNSTDFAITIAAMDALHSGNVEAIYIVSSDQDFAPLARRLRAGGINVAGFGRDTASPVLRSACSSFTVLGQEAAATKQKAKAG